MWTELNVLSELQNARRFRPARIYVAFADLRASFKTNYILLIWIPLLLFVMPVDDLYDLELQPKRMETLTKCDIEPALTVG